MQFKLTITGVDEQTDIDDVYAISQQYPFIEWAVLYSTSKAGKYPRYPSFDFVEKFSKFVDISLPRNWGSLHLCGSAAREYLTANNLDEYRTVDYLVDKFDRVQLNVNALDLEMNHKLPMRELRVYVTGAARHRKMPHIIQDNANNGFIISEIADRENIHVLMDSSGGRGIFLPGYTVPNYCKTSPIGFAGGFGPENIAGVAEQVYDSVMAVNVEGNHNNGLFWIDMETNVRTDDWLDLGKVREVAKAVNQIYFNSYRSVTTF